MTDTIDRLKTALADRHTIERELGATPKTIRDGSGYITTAMIRSSKLLDELDQRYQREALRGLTYPQALARFAALWAEARELGASGRDDWETDLEPDLAVARAVNGLPPAS